MAIADDLFLRPSEQAKPLNPQVKNRNQTPAAPRPTPFSVRRPFRTVTPKLSCLDDRDLVAELLARRSGAPRRFVACHHAFFRTVVLTSSPASRLFLDDLIQEVYAHLWAHDFRVLRRWQHEHPLRAYLRTVILRLVWDRLSHLQPDREQLEEEPWLTVGAHLKNTAELTTPEDDAAANELLQMVRSALDRLNDNYRQILELRYFHELSYVEISAAIGITPTNVGVRITRALAHLKSAFPQRIEATDCFFMNVPVALLGCNKLGGSLINEFSKGGAAS
jgi:RNA polymerase sigma factor (sigma-70 family)